MSGTGEARTALTDTTAIAARLRHLGVPDHIVEQHVERVSSWRKANRRVTSIKRVKLAEKFDLSDMGDGRPRDDGRTWQLRDRPRKRRDRRAKPRPRGGTVVRYKLPADLD